MMRHRNPNSLADSLIFIVAFFACIGLTIDAAYRYGHAHGAASVVCPKPVARMSYDMDRAKLLRRIRYEQTKGETK